MLRILAVVLAGYEIFAFVKRDISNYMTLQTHFVFIDYEEPLLLVLADYLEIMGLFIFVGHYLPVAIRSLGKKQARKI